MTLYDKFQEWIEDADFEDILMAGFMTIMVGMCLLIFITAIIATIATSLN